ncbi:transferase [Streptomyces sp. NPDC017943]|uniref:transferase n=1 Tax=Streptomyces sp. NPDC017943 TaxID=3365019 RepID=UPI0037B597C6
MSTTAPGGRTGRGARTRAAGATAPAGATRSAEAKGEAGRTPLAGASGAVDGADAADTAGTTSGAGMAGMAGRTGAVDEAVATAGESGQQEYETRADCTVDPDGRITFRLPPVPAPHPRLLLRPRPKKGRPGTDSRLLDLEAERPDGPLSAVLPPHPALAEGRWDTYLVPGPDTEPVRLRPGLRDLRALVDGHLRDRTSPVAVRIPYATKDGFLALRTWLRTVHAEAGTVDVTDRDITVAVRLHGARLAEDALVELRLRGTGTVHTLRPRVDEDGKDLSFTAGRDATAGASEGADQVWDAFVRPTAGAAAVRVARLLDDIADRKHVHVYPEIRSEGSTLRPYYTVDNDFSISVSRES